MIIKELQRGPSLQTASQPAADAIMKIRCSTFICFFSDQTGRAFLLSSDICPLPSDT
jgi:hypothetical protein